MKRAFLKTSIVLSVLFCFVYKASADCQITQLTHNNFHDFYPQINDLGQITWEGYDGSDFEIFLYNGTNTIQLTDNTFDDERPILNNKGQVVWIGHDGNDAEIYFYDGSAVIPLTNNAWDDELPGINDQGQVVWSEYDGKDNEIFLYDGHSTIQMTNNDYNDYWPRINNQGMVVWEGFQPGPDDGYVLYRYDGISTNEAARAAAQFIQIQLNDRGQMAWGHLSYKYNYLNQTYIYNISSYFYDGASTLQLYSMQDLDNPGFSHELNDNGQVVWSGYVGEKTEIFLYDGTSIRRLTENDLWEHSPKLNNCGQVTWISNRDGSDTTVNLFDGASTTPLSGSHCGCQQMNDQGQIVWSCDESYAGFSEIFIADLSGTQPCAQTSFADAIQALRINVGFSPAGTPQADMNGDGKTGLAEIIFTLQGVGGSR